MNRFDPLPLVNSWPLFEAPEHVDFALLGAVFGGAALPEAVGDLPAIGTVSPVGLWSCDMRDERLVWSPAVHALFGIPKGEELTRGLAVSCYGRHSRIAMEELRAHAIRYRRGFTLDALIRQPDGDRRWMRLSAMPLISGDKVMRLCGTKQDVTAEYDGPGWHQV